MKTAQPIEQRFWPKVDRREPDECWPWTASKRGKGYGAFGIPPARSVDAHRVSFALAQGIDPLALGDTVVCHSCDNPACVNPGHLFAGTTQDNMDDMWGKDRGKYPFKTHCQRNHELAVSGVYIQKDGKRRCRQCHIDRQSAWERKKKMERASHGL